MNKLTNFLYTALGYIIGALFIGMCVTVPAAVIIWAVNWILVMVGVIV